MANVQPHSNSLQFFYISGAISSAKAQGYYGIRLGPLSELHHGVSGEMFAVDARTLFIKDFNYDGEGPGECECRKCKFNCSQSKQWSLIDQFTIAFNSRLLLRGNFGTSEQ